MEKTRGDIIRIAKEIGVKKGYRLDNPEDWYGGISTKDWELANVIYSSQIQKFKTLNNIIRACFPDYEFLEWKFKLLSKGFWKKKENQISYLNWLADIKNWHTPEDWYGITGDIFFENYGGPFLKRRTLMDVLKIVYPDYNFDYTKLVVIPNGYWNDFEVLKKFLLPKCEALGRMMNTREVLMFKGLEPAIQQHGGLIKVGEKLGFKMESKYKTLSKNIVGSTYEVIVDNFLFLNNIDFTYNQKITKNLNYRYDFKINDICFEIWGLQNSYYNEKRKLKEKIYHSKNIKLISFEKEFFLKSVFIINDELKKICINNKIKMTNFYEENIGKISNFEYYGKDSVIKELREEYEKLKTDVFPNLNWWKDNGFYVHITYLQRNHLFSYDIEKEVSLKEPKYKPLIYWADLENVKNVILPIIQKIGKFPTTEYLINNGGRNLLRGINKYQNGITKLSIKLGYKPNKNISKSKNI